MFVFLSWSGDASRDLSYLFKDKLKLVDNNIHCWLSDQDIDVGARWQVELGKSLEQANLGILFITPDNINSSWLNFEAGALSKSLEQSRVIPLLFDVEPSSLGLPLSQFQAVQFSRESFLEVCESVVKPDDSGRQRISELIELMWPTFESAVHKAIKKSSSKKSEKRSTESKLDELLIRVRGIDQRITELEEYGVQGAASTLPAVTDNNSSADIGRILKKISADLTQVIAFDDPVKRRPALKDLADRIKEVFITVDLRPSERISAQQVLRDINSELNKTS